MLENAASAHRSRNHIGCPMKQVQRGERWRPGGPSGIAAAERQHPTGQTVVRTAQGQRQERPRTKASQRGVGLQNVTALLLQTD